MTESLFKPGARVAVYGRYSQDEPRESFVEKVYKNGNFTLRGSKQQWRAHDRSAHETGSGWMRSHLKIWDEQTDAEIREQIEEATSKQRWRDIRGKINRMRERPDEAVIDAIEAALALVKP